MKPFEEKILDISIEDAMRERANALNTDVLERVGASMGETTNLDKAIIKMCRTQRRNYHTHHVMRMVRNCAAVFLVCLVMAGIVICSVEALRVPVFHFFSGSGSTVITVDGRLDTPELAGYTFHYLPNMEIVGKTETSLILEQDGKSLTIQVLGLSVNMKCPSTAFEELQIGEFQAFYSTDSRNGTLLLADNTHIISLYGQLSKEKLIKIANGIEKK